MGGRENSASARSGWSTCRRWRATASTTCRAHPGSGSRPQRLLINEYGDLETLLERAEEIKQPKRRQTLIDNADQIRLSKQLVQLDCDETPWLLRLMTLEVKDPVTRTNAAGFLTRWSSGRSPNASRTALGVEAAGHRRPRKDRRGRGQTPRFHPVRPEAITNA